MPQDSYRLLDGCAAIQDLVWCAAQSIGGPMPSTRRASRREAQLEIAFLTALALIPITGILVFTCQRDAIALEDLRPVMAAAPLHLKP